MYIYVCVDKRVYVSVHVCDLSPSFYFTVIQRLYLCVVTCV